MDFLTDLLTSCTVYRDHFDQSVEASLRRDLPIITTPHAKDQLTSKGAQESFSNVHALDFFEQMFVDISSRTSSNQDKTPRVRVTGMPGKHVPTKPLQKLNNLLQAVCPFSHPRLSKDKNAHCIEIGPTYKRLDGRTRPLHVVVVVFIITIRLPTRVQDLHLRRHSTGRRTKRNPRTIRRAKHRSDANPSRRDNHSLPIAIPVDGHGDHGRKARYPTNSTNQTRSYDSDTLRRLRCVCESIG